MSDLEKITYCGFVKGRECNYYCALYHPPRILYTGKVSRPRTHGGCGLIHYMREIISAIKKES